MCVYIYLHTPYRWVVRVPHLDKSSATRPMMARPPPSRRFDLDVPLIASHLRKIGSQGRSPLAETMRKTRSSEGVPGFSLVSGWHMS